MKKTHTVLVLFSSQPFFSKGSNLHPITDYIPIPDFPQRCSANHKLSKYPRSPSIGLLSIQIPPKSLENTVLPQNLMPKTYYIFRFMAYCFIFWFEKNKTVRANICQGVHKEMSVDCID